MADAGATLTVRAHPRSAREAIGPLLDGVLHVRVTRPATGGEANDAIRRLLADALHTRPSRIGLASGARARHKRFVIEGMSPSELASRLRMLADGD